MKRYISFHERFTLLPRFVEGVFTRRFFEVYVNQWHDDIPPCYDGFAGVDPGEDSGWWRCRVGRVLYPAAP